MTCSHHPGWFTHHFGRLSRWLSVGALTLGLLVWAPLDIGVIENGVGAAAQEEPTAPPTTPPSTEEPTPETSAQPSAQATAGPEPSGQPSASASAMPSSPPSASDEPAVPSAPPSETPTPSETPEAQPSSPPSPSTRPRRPTPPIGSDQWVDEFEDPSAGLLGETAPDEELLRGQYEHGEYVMEIADPEVAADLIAPIRTPALADVRIMAEARLEGEPTGRYITAVCREIPALGGYRVYLSPADGYFAITRFVPGEVPTILQEGFHQRLDVGNDPFSFTFSCTATMLELAIDGQLIGIVADNAYASGVVSIGAGYFVGAPEGPVTARFSALAVQGSETPTIAASSGGVPFIARSVPSMPLQAPSTLRFDSATWLRPAQRIV